MKEASRPPSSLPPTAATGAAAPLRILCVSSRRALGLRERRHALAEGVRPVRVVHGRPLLLERRRCTKRRLRSFLHFLAAFSLASCCSALSSAACNCFAVAETHLPNALGLVAPLGLEASRIVLPLRFALLGGVLVSGLTWRGGTVTRALRLALSCRRDRKGRRHGKTEERCDNDQCSRHGWSHLCRRGTLWSDIEEDATGASFLRGRVLRIREVGCEQLALS